MYTVNLITKIEDKFVTQTLGQYILRKEALKVARDAAGADAEYVERAGDLGRRGPRRVERGYAGSRLVAWVIE